MSGNIWAGWLDIKTDSKKYYKGNTEAALNLLDFDNDSEYRRVHQEWVTKCADEEHRSLWLKIYTKKCERRKRIKSDDVFKLIDKYEMYEFTKYIGWGKNLDADPSLNIIKYIVSEQYDGRKFGGLLIYTLARKIKAEKMIKKMCTNFITRLYNPHTELGYNYALTNIDWAFD